MQLVSPSIQPSDERWTATPGTTPPTLFEQCVCVLLCLTELIMKSCDMGPAVNRPYPRILESLTICRCHYKGSTFSSVI